MKITRTVITETTTASAGEVAYFQPSWLFGNSHGEIKAAAIGQARGAFPEGSHFEVPGPITLSAVNRKYEAGENHGWNGEEFYGHGVKVKVTLP